MSLDIFKNKHIILDRSIFSAYVWSVYRNRIDNDILMKELNNFLKSKYYENCKIIYVSKQDPSVKSKIRKDKDIFNDFENYEYEDNIYHNVLDINNKHIKNKSRNNNIYYFKNKFNLDSEIEFDELLNQIIDK